MERLDQEYLSRLVMKARKGSSNAFAELFMAVYKRHYMYLSFMIEEEDQILEALKDVYVQIQHQLPGLTAPIMFMPFSCRICYRYCHERNGYVDDMDIKTPSGSFRLSQVYLLPGTESQILIMRYQQGLSVKTIADILNFSTNAVKRCLRSALKHIQKNFRKENVHQLAENDIHFMAGSHYSQKEFHIRLQEPKINPLDAEKILESVFEKVEKKPNSVPLEALSAYTVYRKERFSLQRGITIAVLALFLLLPLLFILPTYELSAIECGDRGLPVVSIHVTSLLPVGKVLANIKSRYLPVYEESAVDYTVEPTSNGTLTISVELVNRQRVTKELDIKDVDDIRPDLLDSQVEKDRVILRVSDSGIGIDYREIYAIDENKTIHYPESYDESTGEIIFAYPECAWDVYIPDHLGNKLHLSFTFEE